MEMGSGFTFLSSVNALKTAFWVVAWSALEAWKVCGGRICILRILSVTGRDIPSKKLRRVLDISKSNLDKYSLQTVTEMNFAKFDSNARLSKSYVSIKKIFLMKLKIGNFLHFFLFSSFFCVLMLKITLSLLLLLYYWKSLGINCICELKNLNKNLGHGLYMQPKSYLYLSASELRYIVQKLSKT